MKKNSLGCEGVFNKHVAVFRFAPIPILWMILLTSVTFYEPAGKISGIVSNGSCSLPFARVRVKATQISTTADVNGKFTLQGINPSDSLVITAWAEGFYNGQSSYQRKMIQVISSFIQVPIRRLH